MAGEYRPTAIYGRKRDTEAMSRSVEEVQVIGAEQGALDEGVIVGEGLAFGRDLANRAANDLTPERTAEIARELEADGCTVEVLEPADMERLGMGCLLGVGQGGGHPPRLIGIKLPGWANGGDRRLAIVGKGVCFDSGGISIKPADGMGDMKHDKSGAAAVIAAARTVARLAPDTPLMAVAPMVENMPGGNAQRPGDVVKAMNGLTVEVTNTDAEGRLILADAMTWAEKEGATHVVDVATLTGAQAVAFGDQVSAYFARPREWGERIGAAAEAAGEWFWEMPLVAEYRVSYDSPHADIVNSGTRDGSLIKSAVFLSRVRDRAVGPRRHRRHRLPRGREAVRPEGRHRRRGCHPRPPGARLRRRSRRRAADQPGRSPFGRSMHPDEGEPRPMLIGRGSSELKTA